MEQRRSGSSTYARRWKLPGKGKRVRVASKGSRIHLNATLTWIHLPDPLTRFAAHLFSVDDYGGRVGKRWSLSVLVHLHLFSPQRLFIIQGQHGGCPSRKCAGFLSSPAPPFFRWTISFIFVQIIVPIVVSLDDNDRGRHQRSPPGKAHLLSSWRGRLCPALVPVARAHPPSARAW